MPIGWERQATGASDPRRISLEDEPPAWQVSQGSVDVFSERERRRHLGRFAAGALLLGASPPSSSSARLIVVGLPEAVMVPVGAARLAQLMSEPAGRAAAQAWASALWASTGSTDDPFPALGTDWRAWLRSFHRALFARLDAVHARQEQATLARIARRERGEARRARRMAAQFAQLPESGRGRSERVEDFALDRMEPTRTTPAPSIRFAEHRGDPLLQACLDSLKALGVALVDVPSEAEKGPSARERIEAIARAAGVRVRWVRVPTHAWTPEVGAFVAFQRGGLPMALRPGVRVSRSLARSLEPHACCFYPPLPARPLRLRELLAFVVRGSSRDAIGIAALGLAAAVVGFLPPALTAVLFEDVVPAGRRGALLASVLALAVAAVSLHVFDLGSVVLRLRLRGRLDHLFRAGIVDRLLGLTAGFFRGFSVGDLITRAGLVDEEHEALLMSVVSGAASALFSASSLAALFWLDGRLGLAALVGAGAILAAGGWTFARRAQLERALLANAARLRSFGLQLFGAVSAVRTSGAETWAFSRWATLFRRQRALEFGSSRLHAGVAAVQEIVPIACAAAFFWVAAGATGAPFALSGGRFLAALQALAVFLGGMLRLAQSAAEVARTIPVVERAAPLLAASPERAHGGLSPGRLSGRLELRGVSFRYRADGPGVLEDLDVSVEPGQFVALVGASGSGKSTLVRLLLGFEQPSSGEILYDGRPLAGLDVLEVRRQIGTVLQRDHLMTGSVFENIAAVRPISLEQAWEAARIAGLERVLREWPMGMHSLVTEGGGAFSGGERQRLIIARAVAGGPRMLLFDEATSALDNRVQSEVMRNLAALSITRIVVAHRLSTIRGADLILVLERGRIVERGDFASLMSRGGVLARLAQRQSA